MPILKDNCVKIGMFKFFVHVDSFNSAVFLTLRFSGEFRVTFHAHCKQKVSNKINI